MGYGLKEYKSNNGIFSTVPLIQGFTGIFTAYCWLLISNRNHFFKNRMSYLISTPIVSLLMANWMKGVSMHYYGAKENCRENLLLRQHNLENGDLNSI